MSEPLGGDAILRMSTIGALLAAAEAVGAAGRLLDDACRYAAERRQFGRTIGSFQALRHLLADMYVRQASSWSSVLYAAAALDEDADEAARTASIAKAYVSRAAREVAHGAMQVFGGIAVTAEHPAHRFLRRIVVRERQFGDAAHHERALGRELASTAVREPIALMPPASGFDDPTAQRLEPIATGAEPDVVGPLLADVLHDPRWLACDVALISGGKSNLTYRVACDAGEVVLRRPPLGHVLPTAHDMVREHRVLQALEHTAVPVPRVLHLGAADGPLGVDFYVMERVVGHVCRNALPPGYADGPEPRAAIGAALVDVLADLHAVDPAAVGLENHGRPAGFVARQLRRWSQQWEASKTAALPALDALRDELSRTLPPERAAAIVHGDYRLDNTVLHPTSPGRIVAVLDWEMSTVGDPMYRSRHAARLLGGSDRRRRGRRRASDGTGDGGRRISQPLGDDPPLCGADGVRRVGRRVVSGVRLLQARRRVPGDRRARRGRRDARLGLRRRSAAGGAARRGGPAADRQRLSASARQAPDRERPVEQRDPPGARPAHRTAIPPSTLRT